MNRNTNQGETGERNPILQQIRAHIHDCERTTAKLCPGEACVEIQFSTGQRYSWIIDNREAEEIARNISDQDPEKLI